MNLSAIGHHSFSLQESSFDVVKRADPSVRISLRPNSDSNCFELISKCLFDLFVKAWEFLKWLFCCNQCNEEPATIYDLKPPQAAPQVKEPKIIYKSASLEARVCMIEVQIDGERFQILLDTGCTNTLVLKRDCLEKITKKNFFSEIRVTDYLGNASLKKTYTVREANIAGFIFNDLIVSEYEGNCDASNLPLDLHGLAGQPFFIRNGSLFCDFPNHLMFFHEWKNIDQMVQRGYEFNNFTAIPLERCAETGLLIVQIDTDFGSLRFVLDTGTGAIMIKPSVTGIQKYEKMTSETLPYCTTSIFKMGGRDFGSTHLALVDVNTNEDHDGILGIEFFQNGAFDLDVAHLTLLIGNSPKKIKTS